MLHYLRILLSCLAISLLPATPTLADGPTVLTVYTYDSFAGKSGIGPLLAAAVLKKHGVETKFVAFPSAGEALNQAVLDGAKGNADLVVGVDNGLLGRAKSSGLFQKTEITDGALTDLPFDRDRTFVPFDYGYLAFVYDSARGTKIPEGMSLHELATNAAFKKKIVIEDPRTSSIGLGFLVWTVALFPDKDKSPWEKFWKALSDKVVTISPGWSGAYGLFLKKEADLVLSYTTSPAYHIEKEKTETFRAIQFPGGHYRQIEGVGVLRSSKHPKEAQKWIETLLSEEVQKELPLKQWMYPVRKGTPLPSSFAKLPPPPKPIDIDPEIIEKSKKDWVKQWTSLTARTL